MNADFKSIMHIQNQIRNRTVLSVASLVFVFAGGLPKNVSGDELKEAKVTQVVQDVKVVPSGAAARPVVVNETVRQGNAVQTGTQSRSELTFRDQTITRLGEKTIYKCGQRANDRAGQRTILAVRVEESRRCTGQDGSGHCSNHWVNKFPVTTVRP